MEQILATLPGEINPRRGGRWMTSISGNAVDGRRSCNETEHQDGNSFFAIGTLGSADL